MILSWGKPTITIEPVGDSAVLIDAAQASAGKAVLPDAVEGSTSLDTTKGDKTEALIEGGENEAVRYSKNKYALKCTIRNGKGQKLPFAVNDGQVKGEWKLTLKPEDETAPGFVINKCSISVEDAWTSADGGTWIITFDALKPAQGTNQIQWDEPAASKD